MPETVLIRCTAAHPRDRVVKIATFEHTHGEGWTESRTRSRIRPGETVPRRLFPTDRDEQGNPVNWRVRYDWRCHLCGPSSQVVAKRHELEPVLDRLRHAGVTEIELSHLGATLGNK